MPSMSPIPLTPMTPGLPVKVSFTYSPFAFTESKNSGVKRLMIVLPAAAQIGLPPKVVACAPAFNTYCIFSLNNVAPIGRPPAKPFAVDTTSGSMPNCWYAYRLPVRPLPVCTSSINTS